MMKKLFLGALLLMSFLRNNAQTDKAQELKQIEISEKRIDQLPFVQSGRNITIITSADLKKLPVQSVSEALGYIAGVDLRQRGPLGSQGDISILGSTFEQVLILIDGIPMRDAQTGHNQLNLPVDISQIERIEILKGTAARIYGANALAGAINIVTKAPGDTKLFVQAYGASPVTENTDKSTPYGLAGGRVSIGYKNKNGKSGHQLDLSYLRTDGYRYNSDNTQQRLNYRGKFDVGGGRVSAIAGTVINKFGANGFYAYPYDANAQENVNTTFGGLNYEKEIGKWKIRPLLYGRYNHDDYIFIKQAPEVYRNNHFTTALGAEFHANKTNQLGQFGIGYESRAEIIRSNNLGHHERYYHSVYAEQRINWSNSATVTFGAQTQYTTDYGLRFYPGTEFSFPIVNALRGFGNVGLGSRLPTYTDLYYSDRANLGNKSLIPEEAFNAETGLKWSNGGGILASASAFTRKTSDFIDYVRASDTLKWRPENFQQVTIQGIDTKLNFIFGGHYGFFHPQKLVVSYCYLHGNIKQDNVFSKYALEHLSQQWSVQFSAKTTQFILHTFSIRYLERFSGSQYAIADYRLRAGGDKRWSFTFDVNNVFNRAYIESGYIPMPGRWFRIGFEWKIQ